MMKLTKLFLTGVLACALLFTATSAFAASSVQINVNAPATAAAGDTVKADVALSGNPGVAAVKVNIGFDASVFDLVSVTGGELIANNGSLTYNTNVNPGQYLWYTTSDLKSDGTLFTLELQVKDTAASGSYQISASCDEGDVANVASDQFTVTCKAATVQISGKAANPAQTTPGSANVKDNDKDDAPASATTVTSITAPDVPAATSAAKTIKLYINKTTAFVNDQAVTLDVAPFLYKYAGVNYTMVPLRFIGEQGLGAAVNWNETTKQVSIVQGTTNLTLVLNQADTAKGLNCPAIAQSGRTLVPLRYAAQSLGCAVQYTAISEPIVITAK